MTLRGIFAPFVRREINNSPKPRGANKVTDKEETISGGYIRVATKITESEIFWNKPDKWLKIWIYILTHVRRKDEPNMKKGQGHFLYSSIMEACQATKPQVDHFIRYAKQATMLATTKATRGFVISILNFDKYQEHGNYKSDTKSDSKSDLKAIQKRQDTSEGNNNNTCGAFIEEYNKRFKTNYKVTDTRKQWFKNRLVNFTYEQLIQALDNTYQNPNYLGQNKDGWVVSPDFYLRNDQNLDRALNERRFIKPVTQRDVYDSLTHDLLSNR